MTSPQHPAPKPTCHTCGAPITRRRRGFPALCPACYRMMCAICNQPIYRDQSFRATGQGHYQHLACSGHRPSSVLQLPAP